MSLLRESFSKNLVVLRIFGLYPPRQWQQLYKIYAVMIYLSCTVAAPTLTLVFLISARNIDLLKIADNLFLCSQIGIFIFKLLPFIFNAREVRRSLDCLESDIFKKFTKEHPSIAEDCTRSCRTIFWFFFVSCAASLFTWGMRPVFMHVRKLPIDVWLPFDPFVTTQRYVLTYISIYIGVGHGALSNGALDPLIAGLACHAAGQFRMLKHNLEHLSDYVDHMVKASPNLEDNRDLRNEFLYQRIGECIEHHNAILSYVTHYENTYSMSVFYQFMASTFVICIATYVLSMTAPFSFSFIGMSVFIATMLCEIFLYSYYGTILFTESDTLVYAVYMGNWYEYDIKSRKALILLMERSKKPVQVTAGKILTLSLETFATVLRRAYSLFAVLNSFNK